MFNTHEIGTMLLEVGTLLMRSGSSAERIRITVSRISESFGYSSEVLITNRALLLTMSDVKHGPVYSHMKRADAQSINFKIISGISRMSWAVAIEKWSSSEIMLELDRLKTITPYPRWLIYSAVSLSGAAFCRLFHGDFSAMGVTFVATFVGLWIRQESTKRKINHYFCTFFASLGASLVSGLFLKLQLSPQMEHSVAASVLFLIPGVMMINAFSDLIDGNLLNGLLRGINGLLVIFSIALGMLTALLIFGT